MGGIALGVGTSSLLCPPPWYMENDATVLTIYLHLICCCCHVKRHHHPLCRQLVQASQRTPGLLLFLLLLLLFFFLSKSTTTLVAGSWFMYLESTPGMLLFLLLLFFFLLSKSTTILLPITGSWFRHLKAHLGCKRPTGLLSLDEEVFASQVEKISSLD